MMNNQAIPSELAVAVATMTAPYLGEITADDVQKRLCNQKEQKEELLTVSDVSDRLNVSLPTIHRMLADGRLKRIKIGRSVRVPSSSVEALIGAAA